MNSTSGGPGGGEVDGVRLRGRTLRADGALLVRSSRSELTRSPGEASRLRFGVTVLDRSDPFALVGSANQGSFRGIVDICQGRCCDSSTGGPSLRDAFEARFLRRESGSHALFGAHAGRVESLGSIAA